MVWTSRVEERPTSEIPIEDRKNGDQNEHDFEHVLEGWRERRSRSQVHSPGGESQHDNDDHNENEEIHPASIAISRSSGVERAQMPDATVTTFSMTEVPLWDGISFWLDGNSKITWDGTFAAPKPNALSLPHIATCPGSTERCRTSCYVHNLKKYAPDVYRHYELNELALHAALMSPNSSEQSATRLATWICENARGGFRWHVSGDVFSLEHADWIVDVCVKAPSVAFWIYTRTLEAVETLTKAENLAVNVSADIHNYTRARGVADRTSTRICYLVSSMDEKLPDLPPGSVIFPDYPLRGRDLPIATAAPWWQAITDEQKRMTCPVDFFGQSESARCGPCKKCLYP